jgi:GT2 family glycosyltransferase
VNTSFRLGIVIVTFNSRDVIIECLESLFAAAEAEALEILVVDNASIDGTVEVITQWARRQLAGCPDGDALNKAQEDVGPKEVTHGRLRVLPSGSNRGYAYGVNKGIREFWNREDIGAFWVLNPDCAVPPHTPAVFRSFARTQLFGLASSRCLYMENKAIIQTDGGRFSRATGVCRSLNARQMAADTPLPSDGDLDYVSGANMLVSREFIATVGFMAEDYFLYYEEVDWAYRRGDLPLRLVPAAEIYHKGGTSIGSGSLHTQPSVLSNYFNHRSRLRFVRKFLKRSYVLALGWSAAKSIQVAFKAGVPQALALMQGALNLPPPKAIRERLRGGSCFLRGPAKLGRSQARDE